MKYDIHHKGYRSIKDFVFQDLTLESYETMKCISGSLTYKDMVLENRGTLYDILFVPMEIALFMMFRLFIKNKIAKFKRKYPEYML